MNSVVLLAVAVCFFALAYRYYSAFVAAKVLVFNDDIKTPAYTQNDGCEYVPTNKWVLFGHHFAAIAGAGPLIGPILAAQYGWGPGFLWILLGSVFAGGVHDMIILFASVRHKGQSLAVIARKEVGPVAGFTTSLAVLMIITIAMAGLAISVVNALFKNPWGVYTIFMTIPIAIVIGLYMNKIRPGAIKSGSVAGVVLVLLAVFTGHYIPNMELGKYFVLDNNQLSLALPIYGFIAATLPVWLLLAPRDYLSTYMKVGTISLLAIGILVVQPQLKMAFTTQFINGGGPIISGPWWPYVFVTIACGAISGFHSLIGSGTTPKMIEKESEIRAIGYGAMLVEGIVALMALIAATVLQPEDYFAINTTVSAYAKLGMTPVELSELSSLVGIDVAHRPGGAVSLAVGMAHIFSNLIGMKALMSYWYQFAIMFEALFILTTIDAGTRVARYILQDLLGTYVYKPFKDVSWLPGSISSGLAVSFAWGYLLYGGNISSIWPIFGVSNQLLAVIALSLGVTIILKVADKKIYALIAFIPFVLLGITEIAACIMNIEMYFKMQTSIGIISGVMSIMMLIMVLVILADSFLKWNKLVRYEGRMGLNNLE